MFSHLVTRTLLVSIVVIWLGGCAKEPGDGVSANPVDEPDYESAADRPKRTPNLAVGSLRSALPQTLGDYRLAAVKHKQEPGQFHEVTVTYKSDNDTLDVVVNDWIREAGNEWRPEYWKAEIEAGGEKIGTFAMMREKRGDVETVMVLLSDRVRVDIKSRRVFGDDLQKLASAIDHKAIAELDADRVR